MISTSIPTRTAELRFPGVITGKASEGMILIHEATSCNMACSACCSLSGGSPE